MGDCQPICPQGRIHLARLFVCLSERVVGLRVGGVQPFHGLEYRDRLVVGLLAEVELSEAQAGLDPIRSVADRCLVGLLGLGLRRP